MPITPTYPGVYIEEVPSGVRTITGVATSITAFIGSAPRGPVNDPITINSYGDYERNFGGLSLDSTMSYAVRDFYLNGGSQAIIVRLINPGAAATITLPTGTTGDNLVLIGAKVGASTNDLSAEVVQNPDPMKPDLFDLKITGPNNVTESYIGVSIDKTSGSYITLKLKSSTLVLVQTPSQKRPNDTPAGAPIKADGKGVDGAVAATIKLPKPSNAMGPDLVLEGANVGAWTNNLSALVDYDTKNTSDLLLFNLTISEKDGATEKFLNVSVNPNSSRFLTRVLEQNSSLVRVQTISQIGPDETATPVNDGLGADGTTITATQYIGSQNGKTGIYALEKTDLFNLLCIPPYTFETDVDQNVLVAAEAYCREKRRAFLLVDPLSSFTNKDAAKTGFANVIGSPSKNAALFFPRLRQQNLLHDNQLEEFVPCGAVAGIFARTDATRGVWKAPAGQDANLVGVPALSVSLTDAENGELNQLGINCLRSFPVTGRVVWGARTLEGADRLASEWKYIPVRRTALFIEESLYRGTQWVVFEPNDEPLWAQIRLNIGAFMQNLFRQGAFQGKTPREAYLVKCDKETTTQNDINLGIVNILVGFAPLKPAEFVIIKIQQLAGQIAT